MLPKVASALAAIAAGAAAAKESAAEAADRAPDAYAVLKGDAVAKKGGKGKWILLLGALAAGAAVMAWRKSNERPDPWATAGSYTPPKPVSEKVSDLAAAVKEKATEAKDAAVDKAGDLKDKAADAKDAAKDKAADAKDAATAQGLRHRRRPERPAAGEPTRAGDDTAIPAPRRRPPRAPTCRPRTSTAVRPTAQGLTHHRTPPDYVARQGTTPRSPVTAPPAPVAPSTAGGPSGPGRGRGRQIR